MPLFDSYGKVPEVLQGTIAGLDRVVLSVIPNANTTVPFSSATHQPNVASQPLNMTMTWRECVDAAYNSTRVDFFEYDSAANACSLLAFPATNFTSTISWYAAVTTVYLIKTLPMELIKNTIKVANTTLQACEIACSTKDDTIVSSSLSSLSNNCLATIYNGNTSDCTIVPRSIVSNYSSSIQSTSLTLLSSINWSKLESFCSHYTFDQMSIVTELENSSPIVLWRCEEIVISQNGTNSTESEMQSIYHGIETNKGDINVKSDQLNNTRIYTTCPTPSTIASSLLTSIISHCHTSFQQSENGDRGILCPLGGFEFDLALMKGFKVKYNSDLVGPSSVSSLAGMLDSFAEWFVGHINTTILAVDVAPMNSTYMGGNLMNISRVNGKVMNIGFNEAKNDAPNPIINLTRSDRVLIVEQRIRSSDFRLQLRQREVRPPSCPIVSQQQQDGGLVSQIYLSLSSSADANHRQFYISFVLSCIVAACFL